MAKKNKFKKTNGKQEKNRRGFTLIEVMVAIVVFSIVMLAAASTLASAMGGYINAKAIQRDLEDGQFMMNIMAKTIRTSSVVSCAVGSNPPGSDCGFENGITATTLKIYDWSQNLCIEYEFDSASSKITKAQRAVPNGDAWEVDCDALVFATGDKIPLSANKVAGMNFKVFKSYINEPVFDLPSRVGRVTMAMELCPPSGCNGAVKKDKVNLQTTVSLRDLNTSGL